MSEDNFWRHTPPPWLGDTDALAQFNAERSRGIMHHPQWVARMAELQEFFNSNVASPAMWIEKSKPRRWWQR